MTTESRVTRLLDLVGAPSSWRDLSFSDREYANWAARSRLVGGNDSNVRAVLIRSGPKSTTAVRKIARRLNIRGAIAFKTKNVGYRVLLRTDEKSRIFPLDSDAACGHMEAAFKRAEFGTTPIRAEVAIEDVVDTISLSTADFTNRGVFSNHYLVNRLLPQLEKTKLDEAEELRASLGNAEKMLSALGWERDVNSTDAGSARVIVSGEQDLDIAGRSGEVAPSYSAIAALAEHAWVLLTNGLSWRLYTDRASASTTTYFELNLGPEPGPAQLLYLAGIFGRDSYTGAKPLILRTYDGSQKYARKLEDNLADEVLRGGVLLNMVKGLLDHDMATRYTDEQLDRNKNLALTILYRILFVLYAEARDMLPVSDAQYRVISIDALRSKMEAFESNGDGGECWQSMLKLFASISKGDAEHNLPQYNGDLFAHEHQIDGAQIRNKFIVPALRGLLERDGEYVDYAILETRHLGSIYERLLEFSVHQAETDMLVREDSKGVRIVETKEHFKYKKNDLYLASKDGMVGRKTTASYYTPREIVQFLVRQGLRDMLREREKSLAADVKKYRRLPSEELRKKCIDRIMDIRILDPAMGSGHFLVEALNQITTWATGVLTGYPDHPIWDHLEQDRDAILREQASRGVRIDGQRLTAEALLKRRIMKRCIFGVDVNPLATELAKVSLWLESFAVGTPLSYIGHHVKCGDSTIGMWLDDVERRDSRLDDFGHGSGIADHIENVSASPDITVGQVRRSQSEYAAHEDKTRSRKNQQDVLTSQLLTAKKTTVKQASILARTAAERWNDAPAGIADVVRTAKKHADEYRFFHWDLEMADAFTGSRRGFDLIVGNFPWDVVIPNDDEFFQKFDHEFKSLKPNTKKQKRKGEILKRDPPTETKYDSYLKKIAGMKTFYSRIYGMQGRGNKDLWQLVMERCLDLCVADTGVISVLVPSTLLNNGGCIKMRRHMLDKSRVLSLYVFENKGIFSIDDRQRFALLTIRNGSSTDRFPAGFFLHDRASLKDNSREADKFGTVTVQDIRDSTPDQYIVPEIMGKTRLAVYGKLHKLKQTLAAGHNGWSIATSTGFNTTTNSKLLDARRSAGFGYWPVIKGECMHQFMPDFRPPPYVANKSKGLAAESRKRIYKKSAASVYGAYRLAFRNLASDTNARTTIAAIIPPNTFSMHSITFLVLSRNGTLLHEQWNGLDTYHREISHLAAILNSTTFDFIVRAKTLTNTPIHIRTTPLPDPSPHDEHIAELAAKLSVNGGPEFRQFADSMGIRNALPTPGDRIRMSAKLDALAAHAYGLDRAEYQSILDSFKFGENTNMAEMDEVDWQASRAAPMRQFFGEVRRRAMDRFLEAEP